MSAPAALSRGDLLRALAVVVIWGLNFVVMKLGLQGLSPMLLGAMRLTAASPPFFTRRAAPGIAVAFCGGPRDGAGAGAIGLSVSGAAAGHDGGHGVGVDADPCVLRLAAGRAVAGGNPCALQWAGAAAVLCGLVVGPACGSSLEWPLSASRRQGG